MRTAEEILRENIGLIPFVVMADGQRKSIIEAMKQYTKEVLQEAAKRAKSEWIRYGTYMKHSVDKQSILSLINELK